MQFHVEVKLIKIPTVQDGDSGNFERTMLFLNTKTLTVYFEGIAGDQFLELIEDMVNQVNSFSSHGSGWNIDRIEKMQISFEAFSPNEQDPTSSYLMHSAQLLLCSEKSTLKMMTVAFSTALLPHITMRKSKL